MIFFYIQFRNMDDNQRKQLIQKHIQQLQQLQQQELHKLQQLHQQELHQLQQLLSPPPPPLPQTPPRPRRGQEPQTPPRRGQEPQTPPRPRRGQEPLSPPRPRREQEPLSTLSSPSESESLPSRPVLPNLFFFANPRWFFLYKIRVHTKLPFCISHEPPGVREPPVGNHCYILSTNKFQSFKHSNSNPLVQF